MRRRLLITSYRQPMTGLSLETLFKVVNLFLGIYLYENFKVEFVRRQANEAAHALSKEATLSASFQVMYEILYFFEHILINEML